MAMGKRKRHCDTAIWIPTSDLPTATTVRTTRSERCRAIIPADLVTACRGAWQVADTVCASDGFERRGVSP